MEYYIAVKSTYYSLISRYSMDIPAAGPDLLSVSLVERPVNLVLVSGSPVLLYVAPVLQNEYAATSGESLVLLNEYAAVSGSGLFPASDTLYLPAAGFVSAAASRVSGKRHSKYMPAFSV